MKKVSILMSSFVMLFAVSARADLDKAKSNLNAKIMAVQNSCSGIKQNFDTIFGLSVATTVSSGLGTVASGAALGVGIAKANLDKKIEEKEVEKTEKAFEEIKYKKELNINFSNREFLIIESETLLNEQKEYLNNYKKIASIYYEELGIILSTEEKDLYFPLNHGGLLAKNIDKNLVVNFISELDIKFISYNFKSLLNLGIKFKSMYMDMMIAYHLISSQTKIDSIIPITEYSTLEPKDFKTAFGKINVELITAQDFSKYLSNPIFFIISFACLSSFEVATNNLHDSLNVLIVSSTPS